MVRVKKQDAIKMMLHDWPNTADFCGGSIAFEEQLRDYISWRGDIEVRDYKGNNILYNDIANAASYTESLLRKNFSNVFEYDKRTKTFSKKGSGNRGGRQSQGARQGGYSGSGFDASWDKCDGDGGSSDYTHGGGLFSWIGGHTGLVVGLIVALAILAKLGFRNILPVALGVGALVGLILLIRRGSLDFFRNVQLNPVLIIFGIILALVLFYRFVGPAAYEAIMNGGLAKLLFLAFTVWASIAILKSKNMGWPIGIKLVVIAVLWVTVFNI